MKGIGRSFNSIAIVLCVFLMSLVLPNQLCCGTGALQGDINQDNTVDANDLGIFAENWLASPCDASNQFCNGADIDDSNNVDFFDYALLAQNWQKAGNLPPTVNAGTDQTITYPTTIANLDGTVTDDGLPTPPGIVTTLWTQQSGPGTVTFGDAGAIDTTASFSLDGTYVLRLTANDGEQTVHDDVAITYIALPAWSETANYYVDGRTGSDTNGGTSSAPYKTIGKAVGVATSGKKVLIWGGQTYNEALTFNNSGTVTTPITFKKDPASGEAIINGGGASNGVIYSIKAYNVIDGFTITNGVMGVYLLNDGADGWVIKNCRITGNGQQGVNIRNGDDCTIHNCCIYLNSVNSGSWAGIYIWDRVTNATITQCNIYKNKYYGIYTLTSTTIGTIKDCIVTGQTNYGIRANTGGVITSITNCDVYDNVNNYYGGPSAGAGCISANPKFTNPDAGDFTLLSGSPCHNTGSDGKDMGFRIGETIVNQAPTVNAGPDQTVTEPVTVAVLDGTVTDDGHSDPPGVITTTWSKQSGPGTVTFANAGAVDTTATFSAYGSYVLRLTASDGYLNSYDEMTVNYQGLVNQAPVVNAGPDQTVTMPDAMLNGTVTDDGLPNPPAAVTTLWSKQSGPGTVTFANAIALNTIATFSTTGDYVLRLAANDGNASSYDDIAITVNPEQTFTYEGYAPLTTGGSGGKVAWVTNLNDSGAGSLRAAVDGLDGTPTTIKFTVGGTINLSSYLYLTHPYVTIAGETAPSPGITLNGNTNSSGTANIQVNTHDVIIRHVRSRANSGGRELIQVVGDYNIIIDHVSCSDGGDGAIDINGGTYNITVSWCILANTSEAHRSYGKYASLHHNLYHGNNRRQPKIVTQQGPYDWRNNVMEAWTGTGTNIECMTVCANIVNIINNYYGPNSNSKGAGSEFHMDPNTWDIYIAGNRLPDGDPDINMLGDRTTPNEEPAVTTSVADDNLRTLVRGHAGAMPRDAYDTGIAGPALP